jgi:hypothetical protein
MTFEDMVPLILDVKVKREAKLKAEASELHHRHVSPAGIHQVAEEQAAVAKDAWFTAYQKAEAAWDEFLKPHGLTRLDVLMAAL